MKSTWILLVVIVFLFKLCAGGDCPRGWTFYGDSCYIYNNDEYTWFDAEAECRVLQGRLVEIHSAAENNFLTSMVSSHGGSAVWISLEDFAIEGEYVWSTTRKLPDYTNWRDGEPNNSGGHEDCVTLVAGGGLWNDAHSGGDCPRGWTFYGDSCYIYINDAYTWFDAEVECRVLQGHLAEIHSAAENNYLANMVRSHGGSAVWIGLEDFAIEGEFVWSTTRKTPDYTSWLPGQPSNSGGHEDCVELRAGGSWNDAHCVSNTFRFICQSE
ncbi:hypothetical protein BaRGS_00013918 [Batillaria attramentaria]|uniref:C-type lectin domain-containing protein n=1 Tax=Batillaria attramentaria TaxID=370345 RepID=A0ABD0L639_9CAEN